MGYFNGYANFQEYAEVEGITRKCAVCGKDFTPRSPNQKQHTHNDWVEDSESCFLDEELARMSARKYLLHVGETKESYIEKYGIEQYLNVVVRKPPHK